MRPLLALTIVFATLILAGCSGGTAKVASSSAISAAPVAPTAETGTISGQIIDEEARPVPSVQVAILETQNATKSDATGKFVFNGVAPGKYRIVTQALGFQENARAVQVVAGEVTEISFTLVAIDIASEPFVDMTPYTGIIQCSVSEGYARYPCEGITGQSKYAWDFHHNKNHTLAEMVLELVWTPSNDVMGQELEFDLCKYKADRMEVLCDGALGADGNDNYKYESGGSPLVIRADKLDAKNSHWITGAGAAIASPYPVYQQTFTIYVSICYYEACADDYSAIPK